MVFNSLSFLVFFAIVCFLHVLPFPWRIKKLNLLVASYLFYAAWNPPFVLLLMLSAVMDFYLSQWVGRLHGTRSRRALLIISLVLNLGLLSYFKYGGFLLENFIWLLGQLGITYHPPAPDIVLPLGISFYTFETISYLVDVYRRKIKPWDSFLDYALFLTFFPHLVAGPIVRARDFLPQCAEPRQATGRQFGWGMTLLVIGLFQKVVLADSFLAPVADRVYAAPERFTFVEAWIGTLAFSAQIFFDFAGYSTCAIGVALCLGFVLNDNFHFPYASVGFSDFWRRWHMSLSSWLRDYLYIPLGGNQHGALRTNVNLLLTMLLGGLWHGASWRFVAWGGLHGVYLIGERLLKSIVGDAGWVQRKGIRALLALATYGLVCLTWVFFRAPDFPTAFRLLGVMFQPAKGTRLLSPLDITIVAVITVGLLVTHWWLRDCTLEQAVARIPWWLRGVALAGLLIGLALAPGDDRAFIYFQF
jgi:alginate O-acetyltransferase complex protein AlgI